MPTAVQPADAADLDLNCRVMNYLHTLNQPSLQQLSVEVRNGEVMLRGKLASQSEKYVALNACQRVAGVLKLCDSIEIAN